MTDPKGNSEFCFPETLNVPEAKPRRTLRSRGNETHCFPRDQSCGLFYLPTPKQKKKLQSSRLLDAAWLTNLRRFQGAWPDHVRVESWSSCFPKELVSFDPRHVTRSPPIGKRIWVERYNKIIYFVSITRGCLELSNLSSQRLKLKVLDNIIILTIIEW